MISEKIRSMVERLLEKTLSKKAVWMKSSGEHQFKLSLSNGIYLTITLYGDDYGNEAFELNIYNDIGQKIESLVLQEQQDSDFILFQSFHKAASDSYYKVDETLDTILESLDNDDVVGIDDNSNRKGNSSSPQPPIHQNDDDLPF